MKLLDKLFRRDPPPVSNALFPGDLFGDLASDYTGYIGPDAAMKVSAVYACVSLIAGTIAALPLHFYRRGETGRERVNHDYWWLFNESASRAYTGFQFWDAVLTDKLLQGDGMAWIERKPSGAVKALHPMHPREVEVQDGPGFLVYLWTHDGKTFAIHEDDVLHFAGIGFDGKKSPSPIAHHAGRSAVGLALAQNDFAERSIRQGNHADVLLSTPAKLDPAQRDALRASIESRYNGLANTRRPMVLSGEFKLDKLGISPVDVELLGARQFSVTDIARIYGVPPHMIGANEKSTSWGSGIESMTIGFVRFTLRRHLEGIQQELNRKLFPRNAGIYCEFELDSLMSGDSKAQADYLGKALGGPGTQGWMTVNEVRRLKNLPPVSGGDDMIYSGAPNAAPTADPAEEPGASQDQGADH